MVHKAMYNVSYARRDGVFVAGVFYPHELGEFFGIDVRKDKSPKKFAKGKLIFKKVMV
jgi:hypothetical protein